MIYRTGYNRNNNGDGYSSSADHYGSQYYNTKKGYTSPLLSTSFSYTPKTIYTQPETRHHSVIDNFLTQNRPLTPLISHMGEVKDIIEKTYRTITGEDFPYDAINMHVLSEEDFSVIYELNGGHYTKEIMGISYNRNGKGISTIYVKQDHMDRLLLTIGHEIGHVMSPTLPNKQDEEAKAHAFSIAWMETIRDNNIGGLQPNIAVNPARNGLHDVAFNFVTYLLNTGLTSLDIFKTLSQGLTSIVTQS